MQTRKKEQHLCMYINRTFDKWHSLLAFINVNILIR